jgi:hypothetical protein
MQFQPQLALHTDDHDDRVQNNVTDVSSVTNLDDFLTLIKLQQKTVEDKDVHLCDSSRRMVHR